MVELDPANMDFAMSDDWAHLQAVGEEFANNDLDFPLTVHATTRRFPVDRLLNTIADRLDDEDVTNAPVFRSLLEEYRNTRPTEIAGTQQLRYFLGVTVYPADVHRRNQAEPSPLERLRRVPGLGVLLAPFVSRRAQLTAAELRTKLFEELERRCRTLDTALVTKASGWSARRVSTTELFVLTMEFWNGEEHDFGVDDGIVRSNPILRETKSVEKDDNRQASTAATNGHTRNSGERR
jgi:hypothetical protein